MEIPNQLIRNCLTFTVCNEYKDLVLDPVNTIIVSPWPLAGKPRYSSKAYNCSAFTCLIVGGTKVDRAEFPHMAAIGWKDRRGSVSFKCGGLLISETFVLTVAHCAYDDEGKTFWIRFKTKLRMLTIL